MDAKLLKALKRLPSKEREKLEKEARQAALDKLDPVERRELLAHAQHVIEQMQFVARQNGRKPAPFGDESALELLSKIGAWMNDNPQLITELELDEHANFIDMLKKLGVYGG